MKVGRRQLYLYNRNSSACQKCRPVCIMDFFVYDHCQRQGFGRALFDFMLMVCTNSSCTMFLQNQGIAAGQLAFDKPSQSLLNFLEKHYGMFDPVWQATNYAVYPEFFDILEHPEHLTTANGNQREMHAEPAHAPVATSPPPQPPPPPMYHHPIQVPPTPVRHFNTPLKQQLSTPSKRVSQISLAPSAVNSPSRGAGAEAHARMIESMGHTSIW